MKDHPTTPSLLTQAAHQMTEEEREELGIVYFCFGCGRGGRTRNDLLRQGCEGKPEPVVPLAALFGDRS